jgi:thiol-disulfide isomerase/thioredoxin
MRKKQQRKNIHEGSDWLAFFLAVLIGIMLAQIIGCESPEPAKEPCCPGSCKSSVQVLWFSAEWCIPCKRQAPAALSALAGYTWKKVDIDSSPKLAASLNIKAVPTYVILINGRERARTNSADELRGLLRRRK